MLPLILASASPRRAELLLDLGIAFTVIPAEIDEHSGEGLGPREMVVHNARLKAEKVAERFPDRVVLAADTTVFIDGTILNKPRDLDEAFEMLRQLSGRTHVVYTGFCVIGPEAPHQVEKGVESRVTFKKLEDRDIVDYFRLVDPLDKAGAYGIQQETDRIVESYEGSLSNIIGLPVEETKQVLQQFGFLQD
ncbi:MAG TPA: nucleoside triphosphate pyrophosphatase [Opitutales bacterium]|nr:nucleoside triphosphate pyrophosphatase [Opitutales bacterium]